MEYVVVEIWGRATNSQNCSLSSVFDLGYDMCKETNVTGRGEATKNPSGVEMRSRRASDIGHSTKSILSSQSQNELFHTSLWWRGSDLL